MRILFLNVFNFIILISLFLDTKWKLIVRENIFYKNFLIHIFTFIYINFTFKITLFFKTKCLKIAFISGYAAEITILWKRFPDIKINYAKIYSEFSYSYYISRKRNICKTFMKEEFSVNSYWKHQLIIL